MAFSDCTLRLRVSHLRSCAVEVVWTNALYDMLTAIVKDGSPKKAYPIREVVTES